MIALYFALALGITWTLQAPALLAAWGVLPGPPERYMNLVGLGAFGPLLAAVIAARMEGTPVRSVFRPLGTWRVGARWYLAALFVPGGTFVLGAALYNLGGHAEPLFYLPDRPELLLAAVVFPFGEEVGWRGFALPRLLDRVSPLAASAIVGVVWTAWHIPMLTLQGVSPAAYLAFLPLMVAGSVVFTWIYLHTRRSLLLAVLAHVGAHLDNPGHAMPGRYVPIAIHAAAYALFALVLMLRDRSLVRAPSAPSPSGELALREG